MPQPHPVCVRSGERPSLGRRSLARLKVGSRRLLRSGHMESPASPTLSVRPRPWGGRPRGEPAGAAVPCPPRCNRRPDRHRAASSTELGAPRRPPPHP